MSPERRDDLGKEKMTDEELLSDDGSIYQGFLSYMLISLMNLEGDLVDEFMEDYDEDFDEGSDDFDADAMSFDDDEIDEDGLVEEHPFEEDAPPQAVFTDK